MQSNKPPLADPPGALGATADAAAGTRRTSARMPLRGAATVVVGGTPAREVQLVDLGHDGLCVLAARPISPGSRCTVSFELPRAADAVSAGAKAVYSSYTGEQGFRIGLVFTAIDADGRRSIDDFLR